MYVSADLLNGTNRNIEKICHYSDDIQTFGFASARMQQRCIFVYKNELCPA
jgi:hypothetical protein